MAFRTAGQSVAFWLTMVLGAILIIFGLPILGGGVWLITLGGTWYYAIAGLGLVVSGGLMIARSMAAVWIYLLTWLFTLVWAFWEVGTDWWAQVPRLVAPTVMLILVLLTIPVLRRHANLGGRTYRAGHAAAMSLTLMVGAAGLGYLVADPKTVTAQDEVEDAPAETQPAPAESDTTEAGDTEPAPAEPETQDGNGSAGETEADTQDTDTSEPNGAQQRAAVMEMMPTGENWPAYGGTHHGTRYSPLEEITPENVGNLERVWETHTGVLPPEGEDVPWSPETTPIKVGQQIFMCTPNNIILALDARTGDEEWRYDPEVSYDAVPHAAACRGVAYYEEPDAEPDSECATRIIQGTLDSRLIAVDARTGQPCTDFGDDGEVLLEEGLGDTVPGWVAVTSPPTIVRDVVVIGHQVNDNEAEDSPSGVVRGYNAITGELEWAWDLGQPDLNGEPPEGETYTRGTPNMWTTAAGDNELGHVYLPLGNSAVDYYGSNRFEAENEYATSVVAVDVETGEDVWHFQTVRRDIWDYDLGSQPALVDFPTEDGTVPGLLISSKQGDIYILNRETGTPLFEPEDREAPQGGVEPDYLAETQPFSTYHTLAFDPIEPQEMWGMTPLDQLWCRIQYHQASYEGMYTPPTADRPYIQYPGYNGGQDWGSMAVDQERGILIANYNDIPNYNQLLTREEAEEQGLLPINEPEGPVGDPQVGAPYAINVNPGWRMPTGLMCKEPPYGGIRAIDLATGETIWDQPLGSARKNGPFGIPSMLPFTIGTPNNGGPVVTASGLIFIAATTDDMIRAFDIETGEELWSDTLPAGGQATPFVFELEGRQYLGMFAGGHGFMETAPGDSLITWALPENGG